MSRARLRLVIQNGTRERRYPFVQNVANEIIMRKEYRRALEKLFSSEMKRVAGHFAEVKVNSSCFWPGDRAYRWKATERLYCWIVLSPSKQDREEFTILIGWSKQARYPELSVVPCPEHPTSDMAEFAREEYLTRLPYLWGDEDKWWVIKKLRAPRTAADLEAAIQPIPDSQARESVSPLVSDAISKIEKNGLPYLEELSRAFRDRRC